MQLEKEKKEKQERERCRALAQRIAEEAAAASAALLGEQMPSADQGPAPGRRGGRGVDRRLGGRASGGGIPA